MIISGSEAARYQADFDTIQRVTSSVLVNLGERANARLVEVFEASTEHDPTLSVAVRETSKGDKRSSRALHLLFPETGVSSLITVSTRISNYQAFVDGSLNFRMTEYQRHLADTGVVFNWQRALEFGLAHELGHATQLHGLVQDSEIPEDAYTEWQRESCIWDVKKDNLEAGNAHLSKEAVDDLIERAHATRPKEQYADAFALRVMQQIYR